MKRLTIRARLTLLYTALFTAAGAVLLAVTYVLVERQLPKTAVFKGATGIAGEAFQLPMEDRQAIDKIFVQQIDSVRETTLTTLLTQGGVALLLILGIAAALAWLVAGKALQPLQQITDTASRIAHSGRGLHERIALDGPRDEVKQLADSFDQMLARLDNSFDGQRRFVANASHELRTPLALNRALVELAITRSGASPDAQQLGEALLKVNERHEKLIDGLLMLADSESEITERTPLDLADVCEHVLKSVPMHASRVTRLLEPAPCHGDPVLLERLVQNLIENAVKHNVPQEGWIRVETSTVDGRARLIVANSGPEVPRYEIETIFLPFRRLGQERAGAIATRGLGLGLSIVRAIATAHSGKVTAAPRSGGGLVVTALI
ncbi:sensor protein CutS [Rhizocola hellebori]|uniref:histidine kinase n=1 Tax=Rhizocola hellebori TaxID=1392758 RepID=A0A8J3QFC4_9ACTN|nr:HAMP domain-containing sensor histidine kinase [Rhizocola hellebori]GIH09858.1 sensor protein CutS [Rhizocola hellebori]